jgi:hypothetical protein
MPYRASLDFIIIWHYKIGLNIFLTLLIDFIIIIIYLFIYWIGYWIFYMIMFAMPIAQVNCLSLLQNEPYVV